MLVDGGVRVSQVRGRSRPQCISPSEHRHDRNWAALHGHTVAKVWEELDESGARADPATAPALASSKAILICNTVVEGPEGYLAPRDARGGGVGALTGELREFLDGHPVGVLATRAAGDGPRQSLVSSRATESG